VRELVRAARARGEDLTGPDGLLMTITAKAAQPGPVGAPAGDLVGEDPLGGPAADVRPDVRRPPNPSAAASAARVGKFRVYEAGRSLRELASLTGRSQTAVRRALEQQGVRLRGRKEPRLRTDNRTRG